MDGLRTDRLLLRPWRTGDLDALIALFAQPEMWRYPFDRGLTAAETEAFLHRRLDDQDRLGWTVWATELGGGLIGYIGLSVPTYLPEVLPAVEVGWRLAPAYWGRGLATEGAVASLDHGFNILGLDEVVSIYQPENAASGRVMLRLGMSHDRDTTHPEGGIPLRVYRLTRQQWRQHRAAAPGGDEADGPRRG